MKVLWCVIITYNDDVSNDCGDGVDVDSVTEVDNTTNVDDSSDCNLDIGDDRCEDGRNIGVGSKPNWKDVSGPSDRIVGC